jgi:hypothetical protein
VKKKLLVILAVTAWLVAGCSAGGAAASPTVVTSTRTMVPVDQNLDYLTNTPSGAPDDVVPAPGLGPQYRGNINAVNPVPMGTVEKNGAGISWRTAASLAPGGTKYNIIKVFPGTQVTGGELYAENVPDWLTLVSSPAFTGPGNMWGPVLAMETAPQAPPGRYQFMLGIVVNGVDYGTFPVMLDITAP